MPVPAFPISKMQTYHALSSVLLEYFEPQRYTFSGIGGILYRFSSPSSGARSRSLGSGFYVIINFSTPPPKKPMILGPHPSPGAVPFGKLVNRQSKIVNQLRGRVVATRLAHNQVTEVRFLPPLLWARRKKVTGVARGRPKAVKIGLRRHLLFEIRSTRYEIRNIRSAGGL